MEHWSESERAGLVPATAPASTPFFATKFDLNPRSRGKHRDSVPRDPQDFSRCKGLVQAGLSRMEGRCPQRPRLRMLVAPA
eukprot:2930068-Rhodomonas_salina.3